MIPYIPYIPCIPYIPYIPYELWPYIPYLSYLSYLSCIPHIPYIWNIIATPPIHTIPKIHAIHTIPTLHSKHSIPIIVTIHTIQTVHTVISNPYLPSIQYHTPTTPQGGRGTVLWLTHDHGRGGRGVGTLDHISTSIHAPWGRPTHGYPLVFLEQCRNGGLSTSMSAYWRGYVYAYVYSYMISFDQKPYWVITSYNIL